MVIGLCEFLVFVSGFFVKFLFELSVYELFVFFVVVRLLLLSFGRFCLLFSELLVSSARCACYYKYKCFFFLCVSLPLPT